MNWRRAMKRRMNSVKRKGKTLTITFSAKTGQRVARRLNAGEDLSVGLVLDEAVHGDARDAVVEDLES